MWLHFKPKRDGTGWEWYKKKRVIVLIHSNPNRTREFPKNSKKMQEFKKPHYGFIWSQNGMGQDKNDTKKMLWFWSIPTRPRIGNFREIVKKLKKLKKHHYGLFSSKTWRERLRMREIKLSFQSIPTRPEIRNSKKMSKKIQKTRKHHYGFFSSQNGTWPAESDKKKKKKDIVPIHSNLTQNWEFLKNSREMQKIKKHHYGFISRQNGTG